MSALEELEAQRVAKFREIEVAIAQDLYGSFDALSGTQKDSIFQEAAHAIEQWEEMAEMGTTPPAPRTPLQGLLREYHETCEQILDIRDKRLG
jgi:hypothetical protein